MNLLCLVTAMVKLSHARRGTYMTIAGQLTRSLVQFGSMVILARLLTPQDFGYLGMILAISGVALLLTDFGLSLAAIQADSLSDAEQNTLFWTNSVIGLAGTLAVVALSHPIAYFYHASSTLVIPVQVIGFTFVLAGASVQFRVRLIRAGRFVSVAIADTAAQFVASICAVIGALMGWGVWALIGQQVVVALAGLVLLAWFSGWVPGFPWRLVGLRRFTHFSFHTFFTQLLNYGSTNLPTIMLGRYQSPMVVGQYNRAVQLNAVPAGQLLSPLTQVALTLLARDWRCSAFDCRVLSIQRCLMYSLVPAMAFMSVASEPLVLVVLGPGWHLASVVLSILAVGGAFQIGGYVFYWALLAAGKSRVLMWCEVPLRIAMIVGTAVAAVFGPVAVAGVISIGLMLISSAGLFWGIGATGVSVRSFLSVCGRPSALILVFVCLAGLLPRVSSHSLSGSAVHLMILLAIAAGVFVASWLFPAYRSDYRAVFSDVRGVRDLQ